jgi:hypothetical protein
MASASENQFLATARKYLRENRDGLAVPNVKEKVTALDIIPEATERCRFLVALSIYRKNKNLFLGF